MRKALTSLNVFPTYATPEAYAAATGKPCPSWNPTRRPKSWEDPKPVKRFTDANGIDYTNYDRMWHGFVDGKPVFSSMALPMAEAAIVNIAPVLQGEIPGADRPAIPCPLRPLLPGEEIVQAHTGVGGGIAEVELLSAEEAAKIEVGFTQYDHDLLVAISRRVGVPGA